MDSNKNYITEYLLCLSERSQSSLDKNYKIGFDWIIYQYALAKNWQPIRLPFVRETDEKKISHKTEAEFGIDLSFYDKNNKEIMVFVLKAEKLTYKNWINKGFKDDIERALYPDLTNIQIELSEILSYKIVTVYNKDDNKDGITHYENLVKASNKSIYNQSINLYFDRWNIDKLVDEITTTILTPDILPRNLSGIFSYIISQFNDFNFGTTQWENQLVPNWINLLNLIFEKDVDDKKINLIPFALSILKNNTKQTPNSEIAWIDLLEWAMLKLWDIFPSASSKNKKIIINIWFEFYLFQLKKYFDENKGVLCSSYGIKVSSPSMSLIPINTGYSTYWHIGRLGILGLSALIIKDEKVRTEWLSEYQEYLRKMLTQNPMSACPLIDLNHIEIFEIFLLYVLNNKTEQFLEFLHELQMNLQIRRIPNPPLPFIESCNRWDLIAERMTTQEVPIDWNESSSYLLTMLLELMLMFDDAKAKENIDFTFKNIIEKNNQYKNEEIDLVSWLPPENFEDIVFSKQVSTGTGVSTSNFGDFSNSKKEKMDVIKEFIEESSQRDIDIKKLKRPFDTYILACLKNKSPLPPAFWRSIILSKNLLD